MATYYADSSVLTKRHRTETGNTVGPGADRPGHRAYVHYQPYQHGRGHQRVDRIVRASGDPPLIFLAADDRLLTAAQLEGLTVDNPNRHP